MPFYRQKMRIFVDESYAQTLFIDQKAIAQTNLIGSIIGDASGDAKRLPDEKRAASKRKTHHQVVEH